MGDVISNAAQTIEVQALPENEMLEWIEVIFLQLWLVQFFTHEKAWKPKNQTQTNSSTATSGRLKFKGKMKFKPMINLFAMCSYLSLFSLYPGFCYLSEPPTWLICKNWKRSCSRSPYQCQDMLILRVRYVMWNMLNSTRILTALLLTLRPTRSSMCKHKRNHHALHAIKVSWHKERTEDFLDVRGRCSSSISPCLSKIISRLNHLLLWKLYQGRIQWIQGIFK